MFSNKLKSKMFPPNIVCFHHWQQWEDVASVNIWPVFTSHTLQLNETGWSHSWLCKQTPHLLLPWIRTTPCRWLLVILHTGSSRDGGRRAGEKGVISRHTLQLSLQLHTTFQQLLSVHQLAFYNDGLGSRGRDGNGIVVAVFWAEGIRFIHLPREGSEDDSHRP